MHPLVFLVRRLLFSLVVVFLVSQNVLFGSLILLLTGLSMMIFVALEAPWVDGLIN